MKKFVINRVDLGQRVTGYEVFSPKANGGEIQGYTPKQMIEAIKAGDILGLMVDGAGALVPDKSKGFNHIMVKTGVGTLTNPDPGGMTNIVYTAYDKKDENFKVISSRFGHQVYCPEKIKTLLDLRAVNGVVLEGDRLVGAWELNEVPSGSQEAPEGKKKGA